MTTSSHREIDEEGRLGEQYVQDAFHSFLKISLAQAKAERLLDVKVLSSAEADLMITGPALCLYFAALRSTTDPPSVPIPRPGGGRRERSLRPDMDRLSLTNCPVVFIPFLRLWSSCVPTIKKLAPEHRHDLARIICDLPPLVQPIYPVLNRLAADLRSISIEISQRRSFQDRYTSDLQAAIDVGVPLYRERETAPITISHSPRSPSSLPPHSGKSLRFPSPSSNSLAPPQPSPPRTPPRQRTETIATMTSPAIELIRETLYAALADVLESTSSLIPLLRTDPPRAYFGAVALAILSVSASSSPSGDSVVVGVRGVPLKLSDCPAPLRPLMSEFSAIGREAAHIEEEDNMVAIQLVQEGREGEMAVPRLERARLLLERGVGYDVDGGNNGRRSAEGRAVAFANRVNALALALTQLPQFKERQDEVFRVLAGVRSSSRGENR
ncbi:hypothetical protein BGY98DRAFT_1190664 [Russula aff. rugulosa BPL654]|nr:hypothetical protein BGY98DRAFT_1190664 [Russula aff. rugulosa BPL654]